jgi:uncharacterized protein (TIGR00290 family)
MKRSALRKPVLLCWSGGKDAAWALHTLRRRGDVEVVALLSSITFDDGRSSMQGVRREVLLAQASACGLPLLEARLPADCGNDVYEAVMARALAEAGERWPGLRTAAFGDLLLEDLRAWRQAQCARADWDILTPLFGADTAQLARDMLDGGLRARLCCVDTQQLDLTFAGRDFDAALLDDLPGGVDCCGENGEFHTCVLAGPMFTAPLGIQRGDTFLRGSRFAYTDFLLDPTPPW